MTFPILGGNGAVAGYSIDNSLRFNDGDSPNLNRTFSSSGSRTTWTFSTWIKKTKLVDTQFLLGVNSASNPENNGIYLRGDDKIQVDSNDSGNRYYVITNALFRDVSAYYHILVHWNTTDGTASNRFKVYVNGVEQSIGGNSYPPQNYEGQVNRNVSHRVGACTDNSRYFDGYIAETYFIDGQALSPTDFGEFDEDSGIWKPIQYTGSYGTNGFYLDFENSGSLGADQSGNGNNFTPTNLASTDQTTDTPTNNFATLNPLTASYASITYSEGNLALSASSTWTATIATFGASSGKWYWEYKMGASTTMLGISDIDRNINVQYNHQQTGTVFYYNNDGNKYVDGSASSYGATYTTNDIIGVSLDLDSGTPTVTFYKNDVSQGTINLPSSMIGKTIVPIFEIQNNIKYVNFGNAPYTISSGNTDDNGYGNFEYAPPSGYLALCTQNLATALSPTIDDGSQYFNTVLYTGTGSSLGVTGVGFQPDFTWIKGRSGATEHVLTDSSRGVTEELNSNDTSVEETVAQGLTAFGTDGFTVGTDGSYNTSSATYASWNWLANGGTTSSNTDGSITSTVQTNTTAGFSIVTWTSTGGNESIGHGLGVVPAMFITKNRTAGANWKVYHHKNTSAPETDNVSLNKTDQTQDDATAWNDTAPTSTTFTVGTDAGSGGSNGNNMVAYCFADIEGYSKFGSYVGNGSADGPFVYTGFRPQWVMVKRTDSTSNWTLYDSVRNNYNEVDELLYPNLSNNESTNDASRKMDFLSNGFKFRGSGGSIAEVNASGGTYIYACFGANPFVSSSGVPVVAR